MDAITEPTDAELELTPAEQQAIRDTEVILDENSQEFVDKLVGILMQTCDDISELPFRPYQLPPARRIFESIIIGDGARLTLLCSRQSGKSTLVGAVIATCMLMLPRLAKIYPNMQSLQKFRRGVWVGAFAPVDEQADIIYTKIVDVFQTDTCKAVMADPEIGEKVLSRGRVLHLKNCGSLAKRTTCHPKASIEGRTYHVIIIDEAEGGDNKTVQKSIVPMASSTRGTFIFTGTPDYHTNFFYTQIQKNKRIQVKRGRSRQNHFGWDWREVARYVPEYKLTVQDAMLSMGEDSDEFRLSYKCVTPETRVLTADLRHVPAGELTAGMRLVGFDEERISKGVHRQFRETLVTHAGRIRRPCYQLKLDDGTEVTASSDHKWLVTTAGRRTLWKTTEELRNTDKIFKLTDVWDSAHSYESGYLAAAFDGEGTLSSSAPGRWHLSMCQKQNEMLAEVLRCLDVLGYTAAEYTYEYNNGVAYLNLTGGRAALLRFMGEVRPHRLLPKLDIGSLGSIGRHDHSGQDFRHPAIVSKAFVGAQDVVALETTTHTFVAEGLASHNCEWLSAKGMFITEDVLNDMGDTSQQELIKTWTASPVIVGIDCARIQDSTVVTVVAVDWDKPDSEGFFPMYVLNWLDLEGLPWETQYFKIVEFLGGYNIWKAGVDTGGVGDVVIDRLRNLMPHVNYVECVNSIGEQSDRWKYLSQVIDRRMLAWPYGAKIRERRVLRRFIQQMSDLRKEFRGPHLKAEAPRESDAHDDYPMSLSLAVAMARPETRQETQVVVSDNVLYGQRSRGHRTRTHARNRQFQPLR